MRSVYQPVPCRERPPAPGRWPKVCAVNHSHCAHCGAPSPKATTAGWPRTCAACGESAYRNPLPVAVALLPVRSAGKTGLIVITRTIEPCRGGIALPGGFIDHGEDWREAVVRELREETGIEAPASDVQLADALSSPTDHLLLFGLLPIRELSELPPPTPTPETTGWHVLTSPQPLAFPLHTQATQTWFTTPHP